MTIKKKLEKLVELIRDGLEYALPHEEDGSYLIKIYEDTLFANEFSREDIESCMRKLERDGIIAVSQIFYAPRTTLSTYAPREKSAGQSVADEIYNKPIYYLHIDVAKLNPITDEPLSFSKDRGFIHFQGKKCGLPLNGIEYYVFKTLYTHPIGERIPENDLEKAIDLLHKESSSSTRVYDAHRRINKQANAELGVKRLIGYKNATYWINSS